MSANDPKRTFIGLMRISRNGGTENQWFQHLFLLKIPSAAKILGVLPNRDKVGAYVMSADFCSRPYGSGLEPVPSSSLRFWPCPF